MLEMALPHRYLVEWASHSDEPSGKRNVLSEVTKVKLECVPPVFLLIPVNRCAGVVHFVSEVSEVFC